MPLQVGIGSADSEPDRCQLSCDIVGRVLRGEADGKIEAIIDQIDHAIDGEDFQADFRVTLLIDRKQARKVKSAERRGRSNAQQSARLMRFQARLCLRLLQPRQKLAGALEEPLPRLGEMQTTGGALEQPGAEMGLQLGDERRRPGSREFELIGRAHEASGFDNSYEHLHCVPTIQVTTPPLRRPRRFRESEARLPR